MTTRPIYGPALRRVRQLPALPHRIRLTIVGYDVVAKCTGCDWWHMRETTPARHPHGQPAVEPLESMTARFAEAHR